MGLLRPLLQLLVCVAVILTDALKPAESTLIVRFDRTPPARSRFSTAVFRYSLERPDGSNACGNNGCSIYCEVCLFQLFLSFFFNFNVCKGLLRILDLLLFANIV